MPGAIRCPLARNGALASSWVLYASFWFALSILARGKGFFKHRNCILPPFRRAVILQLSSHPWKPSDILLDLPLPDSMPFKCFPHLLLRPDSSIMDAIQNHFVFLQEPIYSFCLEFQNLSACNQLFKRSDPHFSYISNVYVLLPKPVVSSLIPDSFPHSANFSRDPNLAPHALHLKRSSLPSIYQSSSCLPPPLLPFLPACNQAKTYSSKGKPSAIWSAKTFRLASSSSIQLFSTINPQFWQTTMR
jgi:hypothetical protein